MITVAAWIALFNEERTDGPSCRCGGRVRDQLYLLLCLGRYHRHLAVSRPIANCGETNDAARWPDLRAWTWKVIDSYIGKGKVFSVRKINEITMLRLSDVDAYCPVYGRGYKEPVCTNTCHRGMTDWPTETHRLARRQAGIRFDIRYNENINVRPIKRTCSSQPKSLQHRS